MTTQHGLLTGHLIDEQQTLKGLQFEAIKKLKEMQRDTQGECRKLEEQCDQMDAQMQEVEQALLEKPPDRAAMNEIASKKAALMMELQETKANAESLEGKLKSMLLRMGMQPTWTLKEVEGAQSFHYISNDAFLENFQTFEDKAFKGETEVTTKKMRIAQIEAEVAALNEEYESAVQGQARARDGQKELIDLKCRQEQEARATVAAEEARVVRTESILIEIERSLANLNDKLARSQPSQDLKVAQPVRQVFVPPVPDVPHIRTRKLLEARLLKLLGSKTVVPPTRFPRCIFVSFLRRCSPPICCATQARWTSSATTAETGSSLSASPTPSPPTPSTLRWSITARRYKRPSTCCGACCQLQSTLSRTAFSRPEPNLSGTS